jgi:Co/Zn/Cd efflux system component
MVSHLAPLLADVFTRVELQIAAAADHFVHWEWPDQSAGHIIRFFTPLTTEA